MNDEITILRGKKIRVYIKILFHATGTLKIHTFKPNIIYNKIKVQKFSSLLIDTAPIGGKEGPSRKNCSYISDNGIEYNIPLPSIFVQVNLFCKALKTNKSHYNI